MQLSVKNLLTMKNPQDRFLYYAESSPNKKSLSSLLDDIDLYLYWVKKGRYAPDDSDLKQLTQIKFLIDNLLSSNDLPEEVDSFGNVVTRSRTDLSLPAFEKQSLNSDYKPVFSGSDHSMLFINFGKCESVYFDKGHISTKTAPNRSTLRLSVSLTIKTLKIQKHNNLNVFFEDTVLIQSL